MNKATLIGRLAADPELRQTGSGIAVTSFTIAVDRPYTKGSDRQTDWIDIVAWRNTAEFVCKYFQKGSPIIIEGSIQTRMWEDKAGQKRKSVEIVAENVEFVPRSKDAGAPSFHTERKCLRHCCCSVHFSCTICNCRHISIHIILPLNGFVRYIPLRMLPVWPYFEN